MAWEAYSRQARDTENERRACEIRLRAERKAGELLSRMEKAGGNANLLRGSTMQPRQSTPTLSDLGISKNQSHRWQQLAAVPADQFEAALASPDKPTTNGVIRGVAFCRWSRPISLQRCHARQAREAKNHEMEVDAAEIRMRAERKLREMIAAQKAMVGLNKRAAGSTGPGRGNAVPIANRVLTVPTLADADIDRDLSSRQAPISYLRI